MRFFTIILTLAFCLASSCNSSKATAEETTEAQTQIQNMIDQGYKLGIIKLQPEVNGCPVVIKIGDEVLDPTDMAQEFNEDGLQVWVKFRRLRMPPRCNMASAISITEIQKKAE